MEIHKHPHDVATKKSWGEYLLEFFMLFLAVFLGFLAENLREHQVNKTKEKEYMASMITDLKRDTSVFSQIIKINDLLIRGEDSELHFLRASLNDRDSSDMALIYFYKYCVNTAQAPIADGTIAQLKNSGDLRLIRNKEVTRKFNGYYSFAVQMDQQAAIVGDMVIDDSKQAGKIFNDITHEKFLDSINLSNQNLTEMRLSDVKQWLSKTGETMLTKEIKDLSPFIHNIAFQMGLVATYVQMLKTMKDHATSLIQTIVKNYQIDDK